MRIERGFLITLIATALFIAVIATLTFNTAHSVQAKHSSQMQSMQTSLSDGDRTFMMEAATGGMAEVELGQMAATKGQKAKVKSFGQRMVRDHSKANAELIQLAMRKGVTLPTELTQEQMSEKEKLSNLSGADFDREYMMMMVADHDKDVMAFEEKSGSAADPDLKKFVAKILPTLKVHQRLAKAINVK
jgi:putative membrane protein